MSFFFEGVAGGGMGSSTALRRSWGVLLLRRLGPGPERGGSGAGGSLSPLSSPSLPAIRALYSDASFSRMACASLSASISFSSRSRRSVRCSRATALKASCSSSHWVLNPSASPPSIRLLMRAGMSCTSWYAHWNSLSVLESWSTVYTLRTLCAREKALCVRNRQLSFLSYSKNAFFAASSLAFTFPCWIDVLRLRLLPSFESAHGVAAVKVCSRSVAVSRAASPACSILVLIVLPRAKARRPT
mmetsp:Transcript_13691/g.43265  ORF Transcript_13691/g.43265 Transcript_13691/m.43265 type:complete len:244 (+) Transcript_13691:2837-3568(+)